MQSQMLGNTIKSDKNNQSKVIFDNDTVKEAHSSYSHAENSTSRMSMEK